MQQNEKQKFWHFTFRYNVFLLGGLYLILVVLAIVQMKARLEGVIYVWTTLLYFAILFVALISWLLCIIKTWKLTSFALNFRVLSMAYLIGSPVVLLFFSLAVLYIAAKLIGPG